MRVAGDKEGEGSKAMAMAMATRMAGDIRNPVFGNRNHNYYSTVMNYWSVTIKVIR